MRLLVCAAVLTAAIGGCATASAQTVETPPPAPAPPAASHYSPAPTTAADSTPAPVAATPPVCCHVPSGFPVVIQLTNEVSSKKVKPGDTFALTLAAPLIVDGKVLAPAGAVGGGEVVDAARAGMMSNPGKLVLAARYVDYGGVRIPLRAFKLGGAGDSHVGAALGVAIVVSPILALAVSGSDIIYPQGTRAIAKVAADITLSPVADSTAPGTATAPSTATATPAAPASVTQPTPPIAAQRPTP